MNVTDYSLQSNKPSQDPIGSVLIVDDREENLFALRELLASQCQKITCAASGNEALGLLLQGHQYSLILLDVQMPGLDGFETLSLIRQHPKTSHIPVIFITAIHKDEKYLHKGFATGAVDYICKPIDPVVMNSKVSVFLELEASKRKLEASLQYSRSLEQQKQVILNHSIEGIVNINEAGEITYVNPACIELLGHSSESLYGMHISYLLAEQGENVAKWTSSHYYKAIQSAAAVREQNIQLQKRDGGFLCVDLSFGSYHQASGKGGVYIFQDITERKKTEESLLFLATHDPLTKLPNRVMFKEAVTNCIQRAKRRKYSLYLMFIDLDYFKRINDELGHDAGDFLLKEVAFRLLSVGRETDVFARLGGDEFAVIFEDDNNTFDTKTVAQKLLHVLKQPFIFEKTKMYISASIGVVKYPDYGTTIDQLTKAADIAMYRAKQAGRNNVEFFDEVHHKDAIKKGELEANFKAALANEEICCFYQPILDFTGEIFAFEVLVRWQHPVYGLLKPEAFMKLAEDTGLIVELSHTVLKQAFCALTEWKKEKKCHANVKLSFNLSRKQFFRNNILDTLKAVKEEKEINFSEVIVEVTEHTLNINTQSIVPILMQLHNLGIELSIDCYGTGNSSLKTLTGLPLKYLKIDKSFIKAAKDDLAAKAVIDSSISLAKGLNMDVIAVGVESKCQYDYLNNFDIKYLQGYYLSEPKNKNEISVYLEKYNL